VPRDDDLAQQVADLRDQVSRNYVAVLKEIAWLSDKIRELETNLIICQVDRTVGTDGEEQDAA